MIPETAQQVPSPNRASGLNPATLLLGVCMLATGACGLILEYILATTSTYILGNAIEQFSVTVGFMLFMMGFASWLQRFVSDAHLIEKFFFVEVALAMVGGFAPMGLYAVFGIANDQFVLAQYLAFGSVGLLIGLEIPFVLRINQAYSERLSVNLARILSFDYIGSFLGAIVWVWYLLKYVPILKIGLMVASINFAIATVTLLYFLSCKLVRFPKLCLAAVVLTGGALLAGFAFHDSWSIELEQRLYEDKIVHAQTTRYQRIVLTQNRKLGDIRLYLNGNLQFSSLDENIYHELLVHPVMALAPRHRQVLILGGGDGLALREVLKYPDTEAVLLVDLDPDMTAFASQDPLMQELNRGSFADARVIRSLNTPKGTAVTPRGSKTLFARPDLPSWQQERQEQAGQKVQLKRRRLARVALMNIDADKFLDLAAGKWDVVIVDLPDPNSVELCKLYSKEFYVRLARLLAADGLAVVQATSPYHAKEAFLMIQRTLATAGYRTLPYHGNIPSFGEWGWILASRQALTPLPPNMAFSVPTSYATPDVFRAATIFPKGWLSSLHDDINTRMRPLLLDRYLSESWLVE